VFIGAPHNEVISLIARHGRTPALRKVLQLRGKSEDLDGVMVFNPQGKAIAHIRLPERHARRNNRSQRPHKTTQI